ncbi:MAG: recombinase zinc beta ribbon domain-containing protein [Ardenticatenaceae bacterium]|nr:recombinase zinc beta ribbon domain-containing protein [Ardenticatenaceae bacterium]
MAVRGHNPSPPKARREGRALLTGIVICARCGRPMRVRYRDKPAYVCEATKSQFNEPRCQFSPTPMWTRQWWPPFEAAQPAAVVAAVAAVAEMETQQQALTQQWAQQLERAAYDVALAPGAV